jgi:DNA-binding transcriptional LysR family regulator
MERPETTGTESRSTESRGTESNWHGVELRHLIALRAVAAERSFSAAARSLGYTQSAVSGQILTLERLIGARLFVRVRGTRPLELTAEGRILLTHATSMLAQLDAAQQEMGAKQEAPLPRVRVGWFWAVGSGLLPSVCRQLGNAFAQIDLHEEPSVDALLDGLSRRKLDLAFVTLPMRDGPYESVPLSRDHYTVVARRGDHVAGGTSVSLAELACLPVLTLGGCRAQAALELVLEAKGHGLKIQKRLDTVSAVLSFVADGFGVGLLPAQSGELPANLVALPLDQRVPPRVLALAWHRDTSLDGLAQRIVDAAVCVSSRPALQAAS